MFKSLHAVHRAAAQMLFTQRPKTNDTVYLNNTLIKEIISEDSRMIQAAFLHKMRSKMREIDIDCIWKLKSLDLQIKIWDKSCDFKT